jgi:hypothetical protein
MRGEGFPLVRNHRAGVGDAGVRWLTGGAWHVSQVVVAVVVAVVVVVVVVVAVVVVE